MDTENTGWRPQAALHCENLLKEGSITYEERQQAAPHLLSVYDDGLTKEARERLQGTQGTWLGQDAETEKRKLVRDFLEQWVPAKWKTKAIIVD